METASVLVMWIVILQLSGVRCLKDIDLLTERIVFLDKDVEILSGRFDAFNNQMYLDKADILNKQDKKILALETELRSRMRQHVTEALSNILKSKSIENIIKSEVITEMGHFKRANQHMKRELHRMKTLLGQIHGENRMYGVIQRKGERSNSDSMTCSKCIKSKRFKGELAQRDQKISELNREIRELNNSCLQLHETIDEKFDSKSGCSKCLKSEEMTNILIRYDRKISEINGTLIEEIKLCRESHDTVNKKTESSFEISRQTSSTFPLKSAVEPSTLISTRTSSSSTTTTPPPPTTTTPPPPPPTTKTTKQTSSERSSTTKSQTTTQTSTSSPTTSTSLSIQTILSTTSAEPTNLTRLTKTEQLADMGRILIVPSSSFPKNTFFSVNLNGNYLNDYSYLNINSVYCVVFISKHNSLFMGLWSRDKIISSKLNSTKVQTVRDNVRTSDMAADEEMGITFLTTVRPSWTISRMTLQGRRFTAIVSLARYDTSPRSIAVHPGRKVIYACIFYNLITVRYDGSDLTTLDTGTIMYAVTLDITNGLLYYGNEFKLMKMSLSTNATSEVMEFGFFIYNLIFYQDRVYYIDFGNSVGTLGVVDVGVNLFYTLQTVKVPAFIFSICLIP